MIIEIIAKFQCDECGEFFSTTLDPGYDPPEDWCVIDVAEDSLRGFGKHKVGADGQHYCEQCTSAQQQPPSEEER